MSNSAKETANTSNAEIKGADGSGFYGLTEFESKPKIAQKEDLEANPDNKDSNQNIDDKEASQKNDERSEVKETEKAQEKEIKTEKDEKETAETTENAISEVGNDKDDGKVENKTETEKNEQIENKEKTETVEFNDQNTIYAPDLPENPPNKEEKTLFETVHDVISPSNEEGKKEQQNDENDDQREESKQEKANEQPQQEMKEEESEKDQQKPEEENDQQKTSKEEEISEQPKQEEEKEQKKQEESSNEENDFDDDFEDEKKGEEEKKEEISANKEEKNAEDVELKDENQQIEEDVKEEENNNGEDDLHTDFNNERDVVKIYTGNEPPKTAPLTRKVSLTKLPPLATTPELDAQNEQLYKRYIRFGRLPDISMREGLIQYLQRQKINSLVQNDYVSAARMQDLVGKLMVQMSEKDEQDRKQALFQTAEEKLEQLNQDIADANKKLRRDLKDEEYKQKDRKRTLLIQQEHELDDFENHWNDQEFLMMTFARPSATLLQLKTTERQLIITKMFDRAEEIKKKCQELEAQESEEAQRNAFREMEKAQKKIETRHRIELEVFEQHYQKNINAIQRNFDIKMQAMEARRIKLEKEIDEFKHPNSLQHAKFTPTPDSVDIVITPRTAQRYSTYKSSMKSPVITVKPLGKIKRHKILPKR